MEDEFEHVMSISEKLPVGQWIAVVKREIFTGKKAKEAHDKAKRKHPESVPFVMKVPESSVMLL